MVQVKKSAVRKRILKEAREEFSHAGFSSTTMRTLSTRSNVSLGNLYTYFADKDDLFTSLVQPTLDALDLSLEAGAFLEPTPQTPLPALEWLRANPDAAVSFLEQHLENLRLVFLMGEGSSLSSYPEELAQRATDIFMEQLEQWQRFSGTDHPASGFFLHALATFFVTSLIEVLKHELDLEQIQTFSVQAVRFVYAGFKGLHPESV